VQHDPRVLGQSALHHRLLVGGVVVTDHLQPAARIGTGDLLEEGQELAVATIMRPAVAEVHPTPRPSYTTLSDATGFRSSRLATLPS
jgi:hypothetical protein